VLFFIDVCAAVALREAYTRKRGVLPVQIIQEKNSIGDGACVID
jgi:hypothetical protein